MKAALLHIGSAKTGTTSIQEALARGQESGAINPACYPTPMGIRNHGRFASQYLPYEQLSRGLRGAFREGDPQLDKILRRYRRALFDQIRAKQKIVISSEYLTLLSTDEVRRLRRDLEAAGFRKFFIIFYVRDPAGYYLSQMQQRLKASSQISDPAKFRYEFRRIAETWEEVFPTELTVRLFPEDQQFNVVEDFSTFLRKSLDVALPSIGSRMNTTISAEAMEILQRYRSTFWPQADDIFTEDSNHLVDCLQQLSTSDFRQTTPALKPEIRARIHSNHRADADFLRDHYGVDLAIDGSVEPGPPLSRTRTVNEVLEGLDPDVVIQLLLRVAESLFDKHPRRLTLRSRVLDRLFPKH